MKGYLSRLIARAAPTPPAPLSRPPSAPVADPFENVEIQPPAAAPATAFDSREPQPSRPPAALPAPVSKPEQPAAAAEAAKVSIEPRLRVEREVIRHEITAQTTQAAPPPAKIEPAGRSEKPREVQSPAPVSTPEAAPDILPPKPRHPDVPVQPLPSAVREAEPVRERVISRIEPGVPEAQRIVVREEPPEPRVGPATLAPAPSREPSRPLEQSEEAPRLVIGRLIVDVLPTPPPIVPVQSRGTRRAASRNAFTRTPSLSFGLGQV